MCLLSSLVGFLHQIENVKKYFFNTFFIIEHVLMTWRRERCKKYALYFSCKTKTCCSNIFQNFLIKMDESSCEISATVFTLANSYCSRSVVFLRILWMFFMFRSNTVCFKKYWLIQVIAGCHYVNLLIFLAVIGLPLCVRHI